MDSNRISILSLYECTSIKVFACRTLFWLSNIVVVLCSSVVCLPFFFLSLCIQPAKWHAFGFSFSFMRGNFLVSFWPRTNSNNELLADHRHCCGRCFSDDVLRVRGVPLYIAAYGVQWSKWKRRICVLHCLVSICGLFCRCSCNRFQRCLAALERNYDHIYVHFSQLNPFFTYFFSSYYKHRRSWKKMHTQRDTKYQKRNIFYL